MVQPISKSVAISTTSKKVDDLVQQLVAFINERLVNYLEGTSKSIEVDRVLRDTDPEVKSKALYKVKVLYEAQEWVVKIDRGSQRDSGTYLHFS